VKRGTPSTSPPPGITEAVNFVTPATLNRVQHQTTPGVLLRTERQQPARLCHGSEARAALEFQRDVNENKGSNSHIYDLVKASGSDWMVM